MSDLQVVRAWAFWEFECPACGEDVRTEHPPPEDDECDACGHKVRTEGR